MWKKNISYGKINRAKKALLSCLFVLSPPLRTSLLSTRGQYMELANTGILAIANNQTLKLSEFVELQQQVHVEFQQKLAYLSVSLLASVRAACDEVWPILKKKQYNDLVS